MAAAKPPSDGLKQSLGKALEHGRQRRKGQKHATAPKRDKRSIEEIGRERSEINRLVPKEAQAKGDYVYQPFEFVEVTERGERKKKERNVVRNLCGSTVERWFRNHRLDQRQMTAIATYCRAYYGHMRRPRTTANWGAFIVRTANDGTQSGAASRFDDKQMLRLFDQDIFFRRGFHEFTVWQNVVIGDEPAGVAGSRLGFKSKQAEAAALFVVQSISNEIANLVVDQPPPDLTQLLLDIDAPRKPRGKAA